MIFTDTHWIRSNTHKMDKSLRKELLYCYRNVKFIPCFLQNLLRKLRYNFKKMDVIIKYAEDISTEQYSSMAKISNFKKGQKLTTLNCHSARLTPKKVDALLKLEHVKHIYLNREIKALLDNAAPSLNAPTAWKLDKTGKGVTTAVIDTGIYPHDDLTKPTNRIAAFKDFVNNKTAPYDDNGHGTHVAGAVASNGTSSNGLYKAPAFDSHVVGVKVLNKYGSGMLSTIIAGIEWCIQNKETYNIKIICMSLGSKADVSYKDDLLCHAVELAWDAGITVCAAAGNDGPDKSTISSPGIDPKIITVGAVDDKNTSARTDDSIAGFSSRGPTIDGLTKPDIISPGVNIISLRSPGSYLDKQAKSSRVGQYYLSLSGTSMATPLCCSCIAVLLESNPQMTPQEIKDKICVTAQTMGYDVNTQGFGYLYIKL